ncbi:unnamed protein product [Auanema sp. JU1783]|nr:unnamed protein product [Auanema sp. JU1783]
MAVAIDDYLLYSPEHVKVQIFFHLSVTHLQLLLAKIGAHLSNSSHRSDGRPMNGLTSRRKQWKTRPWASTASPLPEWYVPFLLLHFVDMGFEQQGD